MCPAELLDVFCQFETLQSSNGSFFIEIFYSIFHFKQITKPCFPVLTYINFGFHFFMTLLGDFEVSFGHILGLLGIESVGDGSEHEDVQLDPLLALFLLALLLLLMKKQ
jgi:hypothetical protein